MSIVLSLLCVTNAWNLYELSLISYTGLGNAFIQLSKNIYLCIITLTLMAELFSLLWTAVVLSIPDKELDLLGYILGFKMGVRKG